MRKLRTFCMLALLVIFASACAEEAPETTPAEETPAVEEPAMTAEPESMAYTATLNGNNEVPGPGDEDGTGEAEITLNEGEVCFEIEVANIGDPTGAHIHAGAAGESGGPVVDLGVPANGLSGCVSGVDDAVLAQIRENPNGYYLNVHTEEFPGGAVRGQLAEM